MSHAFDARFSPTELGLAEICHRLDPCLHEANLDFDGEITRLCSREGVPTVMSLATQSVASLRDVAQHAHSWWGVSLYCISQSLAKNLGRTDSIEVYLRVFKAATSGFMLIYNENAGAFRARRKSDALTNDLIALLLLISATLKINFAIYREDDGEAKSPELTELEHLLAEQVKASHPLTWLAVVNSDVMSFARARELAGPWREHVSLSTRGYVVLRFLANDFRP
jgi:hypothetical protein